MGSSANFAFWIRLSIVLFLILSCGVQQFRSCLPRLPMTNTELFLVAFTSTFAGFLFGYAVSFLIGFPVPFNIVVQSVTVIPVLLLALRMVWRRPLRDNTSLQRSVRNQVAALLIQVCMTYVYPLYFFAFKSLPPFGQSAFTFMLPLIKLCLKNCLHRTLQGLDDVKPVFVVLNVDVFGSFYVASSLQASQSTVNTVLILIVDIAQIAVAIYDIRTVMREIGSLVQMDHFEGSLFDLCLISAASEEVRAKLDRRVSNISLVASMSTHARSRVVCPVETIGPSTGWMSAQQLVLLKAGLDPANRALLSRKIAKVLYMAEFLLLIEFTEVIIPVLYSIYIAAMSHLPNRVYYSQLVSTTAQGLGHSISRVMLNASLELASLLIVGWLLHRELKLSSARLLVVALEAEPKLVQSSVMPWILYMIQQSLEHSGTDYSLQFRWLHSK